MIQLENGPLRDLMRLLGGPHSAALLANMVGDTVLQQIHGRDGDCRDFPIKRVPPSDEGLHKTKRDIGAGHATAHRGRPNT